ncbi:RagB/SusD family nutrient uptake outer membrane protein [uncultured Alistipes sp.]|uniref:RagB/SusD family nutrient uptake outer membrane protein n=1 Tax=uncultured Alistipes sp. TaxID=538949 RepID=UPI0025E8432B|nr:RagB/SusD family nutrient uptake outer membrane protein [uncultured Alistipes sp.]
MKPKYILAIAAVTLGLGACTDSFFEQYPSNNITEGNTYKTDDDFNQAVAGCYAKLKTQMGFHLNEIGYRSDENVLESMAVSTQDRYDIDHFAETASNGILNDIWDAWYNGIYRCNDVLNHMSGAKIANYDKYRGECLFMRSWWYFNLYRVFGVVPLTRTVVAPAAAKTIPRCTDEEMYKLLTEDLAEAALLLPDTRSAEKARVTSIAAYTLLAKVYLTFGKHGEAKLALEEAMKNTAYDLESTTGRIFDVTNKMNKEIIFALYYNKTNDSGHGLWYTTSTTVMDDIRNPTPEFKAIYDAKDNRLALINTYVKIQNNLYAMTKWYDMYDATYTTQVGNDFPHLRYTDVVLMYAEALNEGGDLPGALTWLNKTRIRAGLDGLTQDEVKTAADFRKELAAERGREFALEGHRWFDLVRLGLAVEFFRDMGYTLDAHNLLFPIPQSQIEIVNNPSILWQNPGFN